MGCLKDTVDDVEVSGGKPADHVRDKALPLLGEVLLPDDGNRLTELLLDGPRGLEHQVNDESLHCVPVGPVNLVYTLIRDRPVSLDVILEGDRSSNLELRFINKLSALPHTH